jgi:hypothetical protein
MDIFFSGENFSELRHILAPDLSFMGPFYTFRSAEDYIASLEDNPPVGSVYDLLGSFESESAACLMYRFTKPGVSTTMAQLFEVEDGRIQRILLVFDTAPFETA